MAQPLRKIRQRIAPSVPKDGFSFTLPPLAAGAICIVMLACIGWAFFMGYMVGHGQNPGEEMRELTGIGRPDRETLAEMDKAMAGSEDASLRDKLADLGQRNAELIGRTLIDHRPGRDGRPVDERGEDRREQPRHGQHPADSCR